MVAAALPLQLRMVLLVERRLVLLMLLLLLLLHTEVEIFKL